ncbi:probable RNA-binding protein 46 isoform X1 [Maniola hyperantus]|uniref:probable RNA-binding protein 46 isoform X1 n=1 Tax=Aphantopus hyperantus TaxID=2795564 RepID=UPI001569F3FB|nr:probable RNA-binding protein 46 [Maniola hyperantus]
MDEHGTQKTLKLLHLMQKTGYPIVQHNGQRKFGPPPDWTGPPPPKGCEIFIGKLPRDIYEDELVPLFATVGKIYEMRLMMDFSGSNRGYAFIIYATRAEAAAAVKQLNGYEIKPRRQIGVVKSVDNCRLFIGNIPKTRTKKELVEELMKRVTGLVDVILYKNSFDRNLNRGFAFAEFISHKAAAMARRELVPGCVKLWDQEVVVDWAEPEPDIDDDIMKTVKVLYVRNFAMSTTPEMIKKMFEEVINHKVERIKKIYDYCFIHFYERAHAELAISKLQNADIDGSAIEISWAKPVDRELYYIQKLNRGNAKFNKNLDLAQTLALYKQHLDKKEYASSSPKDEGIGSAYAGDSPCISPLDFKPTYASLTPQSNNYTLAPAKLESMCKRYLWSPPIYHYQKYMDPTGVDLWVSSVELPQVGQPLLATPKRIGPLASRACYYMEQAHAEAAEIALQTLKMLRVDLIQQSVPAQAYSPISAMQNYMSIPYDFPTIYPHLPPVMPMIPTVWRTA